MSFTFHHVFAYYSPMGGERASSSRQRLSGEICCGCKNRIDKLPWSGGERYCDTCTAAHAPRRRLYMSFFLRGGWHCQFLEEDLKTSLPRTLTFHNSDKITEMARKGGAAMQLHDIAAIEHAIANGRGGIWLNLTAGQYAKLKKG